MAKTEIPSFSGEFQLGWDASYYGYIDIGEDRISCRLVPQSDPKVLKLETFDIEVPAGTGKTFKIQRGGVG